MSDLDAFDRALRDEIGRPHMACGACGAGENGMHLEGCPWRPESVMTWEQDRRMPS